MSPHGRPGPDIYAWVAELVEALAVDPDVVEVEAVLDLARETAAEVGRPAVPLTAFLVGCAVGARGGGFAGFEAVAASVVDRMRGWSPEGPR